MEFMLFIIAVTVFVIPAVGGAWIGYEVYRERSSKVGAIIMGMIGCLLVALIESLLALIAALALLVAGTATRAF